MRDLGTLIALNEQRQREHDAEENRRREAVLSMLTLPPPNPMPDWCAVCNGPCKSHPEPPPD